MVIKVTVQPPKPLEKRWHEVDTELDLNAASRETLLEIIAGQRAVIADLQRRIGVLESGPNRRGSSGMLGNQPHSSRQAPDPESRAAICAHDSYPAGGARGSYSKH